jgi:hypothetical protein
MAVPIWILDAIVKHNICKTKMFNSANQLGIISFKPKIYPKVVLQSYCPVQALTIINAAVLHYTR